MFFKGQYRQKHYLDIFQKMNPECQKDLKSIYELAHNQSTMGYHVLLAMQKAVQHRPLFQITLQNISLRLALKRAEQTENMERAEKLKECLDDFHIALDAFIHNIPLDESERQYKQGVQRQPETPPQPPKIDIPDPHIREFRSQTSPLVQKCREVLQRKSS